MPQLAACRMQWPGTSRRVALGPHGMHVVWHASPLCFALVPGGVLPPVLPYGPASSTGT